MILVTGAAGKTGRAVVRSLTSRQEAVRALVRHQEQVDRVQRCGATGAVVADLLDPQKMTEAMRGVGTVYLIAPNMHREETRIGQIAIRAAQAAGVERIVYHSVLHPQTREMQHHWQKLAVEERLFESGLGFTILQPGPYMQNLLPYWDEIVDEGVYQVPYGERARLSLVDLEDVAEVSATVLTSPDHVGAIYELAGPEALTPDQIAEALSQQLKAEIRAEPVPLDTWSEKARIGGLAGYGLDSLVAMFRYYDRHGLVGNSKVIETLLGRSPTTFSQFVGRVTKSV